MPRVWALARWLSSPLPTLMCVCVGALAIQRRVLSKEEETTVRAEWQGFGCMLVAAGILHYSF